MTYLFAFGVDVVLESEVLLETTKSTREVGRLLSYRFDGKWNNRFRDEHRRLVLLKDVILSVLYWKKTYHRETGGTINENVTGRTLHTKDDTNLPRAYVINILRLRFSVNGEMAHLHFVVVHTNQARNLDLLICRSTEHVGPFLQCTLYTPI